MTFSVSGKLFIACAMTAVLVSGCMDAQALKKEIGEEKVVAEDAFKSMQPDQYTPKALVIDQNPWYGGRAVPLQNGEPFPPAFLGQDGVVLTFERAMNLREVARMIQAATNIRTMVDESSTGSVDAGGKTFLPVDGIEVTGGRVVWKGPLPGLLEQVADTFDADWSYDGSSIRISNEVSKTFMLHALADTIDFENSVKTEPDDDSALPKVKTSSTSSLQIWEDIQDAVNTILNQRGRASFSPTTGTITVSGPASIVKRVENYLHTQNEQRLRRVAVAVKVLSVTTSDENTLSFNLTGLIEDAIDGKPFQFSSVDGGLTAGILRTLPSIDPVTGQFVTTGGVTPDSDEIASIIEASEEVTRVSLSNSGAIVTLSDIPAPLQIGRTVAYLERVSASSGDSGNVSLEPGEVNLGLTMNVLPRVIQKDKVLLRLAVGITDADTDFPDITVGDLSIQLPEVNTTGFLQNAVLSKGETLVLAGFERDQASMTDRGTPGGLFTGGTQSLAKNREITVLLITSEVLPEEPLTVIAR